MPTPERLIACIEGELGLKAIHERSEDGEEINVTQEDGQFLLEFFREGDGNWWCQRPNDAQFDLFVKIANAVEFDVEGEEGELFRFVKGRTELIGGRPPLSKSEATLWETYGGFLMPVIVVGGATVMIGILSRIFGFRM